MTNNIGAGLRTIGTALASTTLLLITGMLPARAADAPPATETIALKAAHMFDSTGTALKDGAVVVVSGGKIVSVGNVVPAGARVIDLGDATLLPGFIDAHTHLTMEIEPNYYLGVYHHVMRFPSEQALVRRALRAPHARGRLYHRAQRRRG